MLVVAVVAATMGLGLGWLAWRFWVIGLAGVVLGVALGWTLAVLGLWLGLRPRWPVIALAVAIGWAALQGMEDRHAQDAFRVALAEGRAAATGLPPAEIARLVEVGGLDYLAEDSEALYAAEVQRETGLDGVVGRWVLRARGGVRLAGSWRQGRSLPVGVPGYVVASLLELALAGFIAHRVVRAASDRFSSLVS